jgi:hypothetical protein
MSGLDHGLVVSQLPGDVRATIGPCIRIGHSGVRQFCIQPGTPVFVGKAAGYQDVAPILLREPDEMKEALPLASRSQDDTLLALKAEGVSGQISEAAGNRFRRADGKIAVDTVPQPRSGVGHLKIMLGPHVSARMLPEEARAVRGRAAVCGPDPRLLAC